MLRGKKKRQNSEEHVGAADSGEVRDADFSELEGETQKEQQNMQEEIPPIPSVEGNTAEVAAITEEFKRCKGELEEAKDKYMRALAEFENYKRRAIKERSELLKYQGEQILVDILEVLDNLELALQHSSADPAQLRSGLQLIHKKFVDILGKWEVRSDSAKGKEFDPTKHQAISKVVLPDTKPGTVVDEFRKAYFYKDKLLRVADVVVSEDDKRSQAVENNDLNPEEEAATGGEKTEDTVR